MKKAKEKNPFKFQGFSERIANIKVDISHRVERTALELGEESETFCKESLDKWMELHCTVHFQEFVKEIRPLVQTLVQLLHHKQQVFSILKKHLLIQDTLALEPLLDIVVQLARDLQCDFYPHFEELFYVFTSLLSRNVLNSEALEQIFMCIGYLFKYLWRYMVKDMENVFRLYSPLLSKDQRPYIRQFAAESFAFLIRKVKDQNKLFEMLFMTLNDDNDIVEGLGYLLFETVKGVQKQFHSQTEKVLLLMLSKLGPAIDEGNNVDIESHLPWELVFQCLSHSLQLMAKYTTKEHCHVVSSSLTHQLMSLFLKSEKILPAHEPGAFEALVVKLKYTVELTTQWVSWKNGCLVTDPLMLHDVVRSLLRAQQLAKEVSEPLLNLTSSIILANFSTLRRDIHTKDLITNIYHIHPSKTTSFPLEDLLAFGKSLLQWEYFKDDVLPHVLGLCQARLYEGVMGEERKEVVLMLVEVILAGCVDSDYGADITPKKGLIYFPKCGTKAGSKILDCFTECLTVGDGTDLALAWGALIVLPCIRPLNGAKLSKAIKEFIHQSLQYVSQEKGEWLFVISQAVLSYLLVIQQSKNIDCDFDISTVTQMLSHFPDNIHILHACHGIFSHFKSTITTANGMLSAQNLESMYFILRSNLSHHAHLVRLKTLQILSEFEQLELVHSEENPQPGQCNVFKLCLDAESALPTFQQYRNKDILLRKLTYSKSYYNSLPEPFKDVPIRFLIGQLYINFSPMWKIVMEVIQSMADREYITVFWPIFREHLEMAATNTEKELSSEPAPSLPTSTNYDEGTATCIEQVFTSLLGVAVGKREDNRVDHSNFRYLLWKAMAEFPAVVELKSRDLVPLLLRFISNEYKHSDDHTSPTQDIRKIKNDRNTIDDSTNPESSQDPDESQHESQLNGSKLDSRFELHEGELNADSNSHSETQFNTSANDSKAENLSVSQNTVHHQHKKAATKSLCVHLNLFSLFHNPKALSKEPQVREIYFTMLCHRDGEVQKLAVKCIQTYKFPYMTPYKESLEKFLEDESFKDELTKLMASEGEGAIEPAHREQLMPIIIRLLYGKMQRWHGAGSSGKAGVSARRSTVFRSLGICSYEELKVFMDLILAPFKHLCDDNLVTPVTCDLSSVVPLKKQIGFLHMLQQILSKLGETIDGFLPSLLKICISLLSSCDFCLQHRDEVRTQHIAQLKQIRQLAIHRLIDFFEKQHDYDFAGIMDNLFDAAVWPQIEALEQESLQSPTPLLKLLHCWSKSTRFIPLLSKQPINKPDMSIVGHVLKCLVAPSVTESVVTMVMEIAENLLTAHDSEDDGDVDMKEHDMSSPSLGITLVLPHIHIILAHLTSTFKSFAKQINTRHGPKRAKTGIPKLGLSLLSKISPYVTDNENSTALLNLLIPLLQMRQREDTEIYMLKTIVNLLSNVDSPLAFVKPLGKLFSQFNSRSSRHLLCEIFQEIAQIEASFGQVATIVTQLNAWDNKKIDEPDYGSRIDGFEAAAKLFSGEECRESGSKAVNPGSKSPLKVSPSKRKAAPSKTDCNVAESPTSVTVDHIIPILQNCLYFVHRSADMALRDAAVSCINAIIQRVVRLNDEVEFKELILNCVLRSCKLAMKSKSESARSEFLGILSVLVRNFDHAIFEDMKILIDDDPEMNFFENIRHIQLHRRIRSLRRLELLCSKNTFKPSTLVSFLLPLTTAYLNEYSSAKDHNVAHQAIATIGAIASGLPWSKYLLLLKTYLRAMSREKEKHKIVARVLVAVLNSFHFDLSKLTFTDEELTQVQKQLQSSGKTVTSNTENVENNPKEDTSKNDAGTTTEENDDTAGENADDGDEADGDEVDDDGDEVVDDGDVEASGGTNNIEIDRALANRIYTTITTRILPQLSKSLTKKRQSYHKLSKMKKNDEEEALRVPIILAMVKLLQSLPEQTLHLHLPGLLLRVCMTLKSRARDVRDTARDVLCKIALSLGSKYFLFIIQELKSSLTRGYQLHILGFTLHSLLEKMSPTLTVGDIDHCIPDITQILVDDLFGEVANEREVDKLANKLHEAKSSKSYDSFEILSKHAGSTSLSLLVTPLQEVLDSNQSHKISQRVEDTLRRISIGLQANTELPVQTIMVFIHRIINDKLPVITAKKQGNKEEPKPITPEKSLRPQDAYIITPTPIRGGNAPGISTKTNAHIIVEFSLQMLNTTLKRGKISSADQAHMQLLDPFVNVLSKCLQTKYTKVLTLSLRSLCFVIRLPLPSLETNVPAIAKLLFQTLQKYSKAGAKVGENYEMVLSAFKAMTAIIRDFEKYKIAQKHLQVLLGLVEEDMHDHTRQGTAFPLLKAILTRKLIVPEIHDVMKKVSQLSITGTSTTVQQQCRQCIIQYLLDYPLGKKLPRHLEFIVSQLSYEHETGRESALELITSIFNTFPESLLFKYSSFFFVPLTTRLVNDDSANCRKLTAMAIKNLLQKLDFAHRDELFAMVVQWFSNEKVVLRRLAAQLCGLFVEVEQKDFNRRLDNVLPLIAELIEPAQYETEDNREPSHHDDTSLHKSKDQLLFNALTTFAKILQDNKQIWTEKYADTLDEMWVSVENHLLHPHAWVRLVSSRLFGLLFSNVKPEELVKNIDSKGSGYLTADAYNKVVKLCKDFCIQLNSYYLHQDLSDQIVKNLVFLAKVLLLFEEDETERDFTLSTLFSKTERLATYEASQTPKKTHKRSCVMRLVAAIAVVLGKDNILDYLKEILQPVHRELEIQTTYKDPELQKVTQEVLELVKGIVGREAVSRVYASLQSDVTDTKEQRKKKRALEAVADPAQSTRKKIKRNLLKREARKRKIDKFKPERKLKKTRFVDQDD